MGWKDIKQAAAGGVEELATAQGKNNLVFYLVSRFIVVLVAVMAVESAVVALENFTFVPFLQNYASGIVDPAFETTSAGALMQWAWAVLMSLLRSGPIPVVQLASNSAVIAVILLMLLLLATPIVVGALVFSTLVVRKVRALQEQRERELAQIEQQRSQFITDIAHDLRTPLMAISGMSHALADGLVRDEAQRDEYLRSIRDKSDKLGELVNAVFDYSKLGSGSFKLDRVPIDLPQLLLREAAAAYTDAEEAGVQLTTCIPEEPCRVLVDEVQFGRVIANLIVNAIKHNPAGTEVSVIMVRQAAAAFVMVADTGVAIPGNADDLFQPFAQGDAARTHAKGGSGLGLSICKRIADMHGFTLTVSQPYGRFTKAFVLHCPLPE